MVQWQSGAFSTKRRFAYSMCRYSESRWWAAAALSGACMSANLHNPYHHPSSPAIAPPPLLRLRPSTLHHPLLRPPRQVIRPSNVLLSVLSQPVAAILHSSGRRRYRSSCPTSPASVPLLACRTGSLVQLIDIRFQRLLFRISRGTIRQRLYQKLCQSCSPHIHFRARLAAVPGRKDSTAMPVCS